MDSICLGVDSLRLDQRSILANQEEHRTALASQDVTLRALYTSFEVTMRRAAHDQRQGRSMAFDAMCAMEAPTSTIPFPQAEVASISFRRGTNPSNHRPPAVENEESRSGASDICVRSHFSVSLPDLI